MNVGQPTDCSRSDPITIQTRAVNYGKSYLRDLVVYIDDAKFNVHAPGTVQEVIKALKVFVSVAPLVNQTTQH